MNDFTKQELDKKSGTVICDGTKTYHVKLDLGIITKESEYIVDKFIMPFLFPNSYRMFHE